LRQDGGGFCVQLAAQFEIGNQHDLGTGLGDQLCRVLEATSRDHGFRLRQKAATSMGSHCFDFFGEITPATRFCEIGD
jgi:hypothetical protein